MTDDIASFDWSPDGKRIVLSMEASGEVAATARSDGQADKPAGADTVIARGLADPQRLGIGCWSYGGILTDYTIATDPRFKVAFSGAGRANQALWLKLPCPFFHAARTHTPRLIMGGDRISTCPLPAASRCTRHCGRWVCRRSGSSIPTSSTA